MFAPFEATYMRNYIIKPHLFFGVTLICLYQIFLYGNVCYTNYIVNMIFNYIKG